MRNSFRESHFKIWKMRIDKHVQNSINMSIDDLPDEPYRIWFEDTNMTPLLVSHFVLYKNGFQLESDINMI